MGFAATESTIRSRFNTQWISLRPTIPVFFDNAGDDVTPPQNSAWVRLTVLPKLRWEIRDDGDQRELSLYKFMFQPLPGRVWHRNSVTM
jgi:hypothetical protein